VHFNRVNLTIYVSLHLALIKKWLLFAVIEARFAEARLVFKPRLTIRIESHYFWPILRYNSHYRAHIRGYIKMIKELSGIVK
jgi:hypothetical protein